MAIRKAATTDGGFSRELIVRFDCEDNALIGRHQLIQSGTRFEANGNDPWLLLKPGRRLRRGWYRIDLKAEFEGQAEPRLYFNFGHGFQERFACPLHRVGSGFSAIVRAYKPTLSLRLDPTELPGKFELLTLSISPAPWLALAGLRLRQIAATLASALRKPSAWRDNLRNLRKGYLSTRGFVPMPVRFDAECWTDPYRRWIATYDYCPKRDRPRIEAQLQGSRHIRTNLQLLQAVRAENPAAWIVYKHHPDVVARLRRGGAQRAEIAHLADEILANARMPDLLDGIDEVHTLTSLTGFEALLRGKSVTCYGLPFYAGWGLTRDIEPMPRRNRHLTLDELTAAALILYPTYVSARTGAYTTPERIIDEILAAKAQSRCNLLTALATPLLRLRPRSRLMNRESQPLLPQETK